MRRIFILSCVFLGACGGGGGGGLADFVSDDSLRLERAYPGLTMGAPLVVTTAPGDSTHLYVARQGGLINVFEARDDITTADARVFLDLTDRTTPRGEQGLLGLAFDPEFASSGNNWVYVHYNDNLAPDSSSGCASRRGDTVVARYRVDRTARVADGTSEEVLFRHPQPFDNHNGGSIAFGPNDGKLYIALGDGGSGNDPCANAQNLANPLGKILRINKDGSVPDNPFSDTVGARPEIWALGMRNPFRMSFDPATGRLWAGDVGQGALEEIDLIVRGGNYGWRRFEGTRTNTGDVAPLAEDTIFPIFQYGRDQGRSITGGVVYRGARLPFLNGRYVYGDFVSGRVWVLSENDGRATANVEIGGVPNPSSFGYDHSGEIIITAYDGGLYRLVAAPDANVGDIPERLSEAGLFTDLARLTPAAGMTEYAPNAPFWSDGSLKRRWFKLPPGGKIGFSADGAWEFPVGAMTVKHFEIETSSGLRRLETRVFLRQDSGAWLGYSYLWNDSGTEATLLNAGATIPLLVPDGAGGSQPQTYRVPDRAQCLQCHTSAAGEVLGVRTNQLNGLYTYADGSTQNQLSFLSGAGVFDAPIDDPSTYPALPDPFGTAPLALRARAYLETNCAQCHQPGGPTPVNIDLRAATPIADTNTVGVTGTGTPVGGATVRIVAGDKDTSLVWTRINTRAEGEAMPPLSTHVIDAQGVDLIGDWIDAGAN